MEENRQNETVYVPEECRTIPYFLTAVIAAVIGAGYLLLGSGWDGFTGAFILFYFAVPLFAAAVIRLMQWLTNRRNPE